MCGLTGYLGGDWSGGRAAAEARIAGMAGGISHRGPDSKGIWCDAEAKVALGHNRLAILDLSPAGEQPMASARGRFVIVYNGEIYNHLALRDRLHAEGAGANWRGHSDTETLLAGFEAWGVEKTLKLAVGMFAFALWDRQDRELILARDRLGEKPLYYGWQGKGADAAFLFGSELKALRRHPAFAAEIDRSALALYTRFSYVPAPHSIYRGISKLEPGTYLTLAPGQSKPVLRTYWSGAETALAGTANPLVGSDAELLDQLEAMLRQAVGRQMLADVPLGAFLSGGVDSSLIVALMQAQSARPVKSFSIGFHEEAYNEAAHAKAVAEHLGTDHTEMYVSPAEAMAVIPTLPSIYDEPFGDSSQIPTILVSQLARSEVTVSLSGDAGDELFGGYNRYKMTAAHWGRIARLPRPLRQLAARVLMAPSPDAWDRIAAALRPLLPTSMHMALPGEKVHKGAGVLASGSIDELYARLVSQWQDPQGLVIGAGESRQSAHAALDALGPVERMMAIDMLTYLPDDILVKVDRASMSVSLESRVPFLDHEVVEFAWRLPMHMKLRGGETKWALRQLLYRHVPRALIERPKMGFGVPIDAWLRGPLKSWAGDLLSPARIEREGYFQSQPVRQAWDAHQAGAKRQHQLWNLLMFQSWLDEQAQSAPASQAAPPPRSANAA